MHDIPSIPARALAAALGMVILAAAGGPVAAQHDPQSPMSQHAMPSHAQAVSPADQAYQAAMDRMQSHMAMDFTGDADVDFARGMIPHHQGAIDMAQAVLQYGADPEIRKLAEGIIRAQEEEIAFLRAWLEKRGQKAG